MNFQVIYIIYKCAYNGLLMCEKVAENCTLSKNKGDEHLFFCSYDKLTDTNLYAVFTSFPVIYTGVSSSLILFLALLTKWMRFTDCFSSVRRGE